MSGKKIFWLGKGTLGNIKHGEEIPDGYLSISRLRKFEKENLIGEKIAATNKGDDSKIQKIKDLLAENEDISIKLMDSDSELKNVKEMLSKVEDSENLMGSLKEKNIELNEELKNVNSDFSEFRIKATNIEDSLSSEVTDLKTEIADLKTENKKIKKAK